jgi:hypothetical protein
VISDISFQTEATFQFDNNLPAIDEDEVKSIEAELVVFLKQQTSNKLATGASNQSSNSSVSFTASSSSSSSSCGGAVATSSPLASEKHPPKTSPMESVMEEELAKSGSNNSNYVYIIKELNLFTQSQSARNELLTDSTRSAELDLQVLNKLSELLGIDQEKLLSLSVNQEKIPTTAENITTNDVIDQNSKSKEEEVQNTSRLEDQEQIKRTIQELKDKMNDTRNYVKDYQSEISAYLAHLVAQTVSLNQATNEKVAVSAQNETVEVTEENLVKTRQAFADYPKLFSLIESKNLLDPSQETELTEQIGQLLGLDESGERAFVNRIVSLLKEQRASHAREIEELRASMQAMKMNMNAEKQIMFNEAIKRATKEKDRLIDELRSKQDECLTRVGQLEEELEKYRQAASAAVTVTKANTNQVI